MYRYMATVGFEHEDLGDYRRRMRNLDVLRTYVARKLDLEALKLIEECFKLWITTAKQRRNMEFVLVDSARIVEMIDAIDDGWLMAIC